MNDMNNEKEKNPFFLPALIATFISLVCTFVSDYISGAMFILLSIPMYIAPVVAIILSGLGLAKSKKSVIGCACCLVIAFLNIVFVLWRPFYLYDHHTHSTIVVAERSYSPEEIESINEELNRIMHGGNTTETSK